MKPKITDHWSEEYCTLRLLVVYFIDGDGNIQHNSFCFISDDNNHDTNFVYEIQTVLVDYRKENLPIVDKIFCFSDGCAEQYKNHKNFINLCHRQQDFTMDAEWIFFATSHHAMVLGDLLNVILGNVVYKDHYMTKF